MDVFKPQIPLPPNREVFPRVGANRETNTPRSTLRIISTGMCRTLNTTTCRRFKKRFVTSRRLALKFSLGLKCGLERMELFDVWRCEPFDKQKTDAVFNYIEEEEPLLGNMTAGVSSVSLDGHSAKRFPQYVAALAATFGGFVMGTVLAWTSPANPKLSNTYDFEFSSFDKDMIGGFVSIGAMFGALIGGTLCNKFGRKGTMIVLALPSCVGWGLIIWADSVGMMFGGRIVLGIVIGAFTVACPLYTTEIGETAIRGTLGTYFQLQVTIGIFFDYVIGDLVEKVFWFNIICAVFPIVLALFMTLMPESPNYYLLKKNEAAARKALQWLRGDKYDINSEINTMNAAIEKVESEKLSISEAFSTTPAKRGLIIGLGVMFFQQMSGINGVIFYSSDIFKSSGASLSPGVSSMIIGGVSVVATYISTLVIDKLGRKPLLFFSDTVMAISAGVLGLYFYLQETGVDVSNIGWLPVTSVSVFIIVFSLGLGPIPWMFIGEIFPPSIKGPATSIACLFNWLCAFAVTIGFGSVCKAIHTSFTFWGFAVISAVGAFFVATLIPETKGKSLVEIQRSLGGDAPSNVTDEKPTRIA